MAEWQLDPENPEILGYEVTGRGAFTGCGLVIVGLVSGFFTLLGLLIAGFGEDLEMRGFGVIALLIGGVGLYTAFWNWGRDYRSKMEFDRRAGEFRIQSATTHQQSFRVPIASFERLHGYQVRRRSSGQNTSSYVQYMLALVGQDGSEMVIQASGNEQATARLGEQLADFTGLPFRNAFDRDPDSAATSPIDTDIDRERATSAAPVSRSRPLTPANPQYVNEESTVEGRVLSLQGAGKTASELLIAAAVFAVFFGAPLLIFGGIFGTVFSGDAAPGDYFFLTFGVLFCIAFYSIALAILLLQFRRYLLVLRADRLIVRVQLRVLGLTLLSRDVPVPAAQIASTQINLSEEGHFWLGLVVTPDYTLPMAAQFLTNIGPFSKGIQTGPDDQKRISL